MPCEQGELKWLLDGDGERQWLLPGPVTRRLTLEGAEQAGATAGASRLSSRPRVERTK